MVKNQNSETTSSVNQASWKPSPRPPRQKTEKTGKKAKCTCTRCGYVHRSTKEDACPAKKAECRKCHKIGHFEAVCKSKQVREVQETPPEEASPEETPSDDWFLGTVKCKDTDPPSTVTLPVSGQLLEFKIDSGADTSVISEETYHRLQPSPKLHPVSSSLVGVGGPLKCRGQFIAHTEVKEQTYDFRIVVVKSKVASLLSRSVASRMGLILKVEKFEEVFGDIARFNAEPVKIMLQDGAEPYTLSVARRVPIPPLPPCPVERFGDIQSRQCREATVHM